MLATLSLVLPALMGLFGGGLLPAFRNGFIYPSHVLANIVIVGFLTALQWDAMFQYEAAWGWALYLSAILGYILGSVINAWHNASIRIHGSHRQVP